MSNPRPRARARHAGVSCKGARAAGPRRLQCAALARVRAPRGRARARRGGARAARQLRRPRPPARSAPRARARPLALVPPSRARAARARARAPRGRARRTARLRRATPPARNAPRARPIARLRALARARAGQAGARARAQRRRARRAPPFTRAPACVRAALRRRAARRLLAMGTPFAPSRNMCRPLSRRAQSGASIPSGHPPPACQPHPHRNREAERRPTRARASALIGIAAGPCGAPARDTRPRHAELPLLPPRAMRGRRRDAQTRPPMLRGIPAARRATG